ncbi:MAG TPA: DMT family transporter [Actinomycetota bacterium]|jgi:drug/metabolite transporter (DMT)-like permease|nr:DMT family transporter [Actinomycetota bacterium]
MPQSGERIALASFAGTVVFAGGNAVSIRFSNRELDPFWGATVRFLLAGALLAAVVLVLRIELPRGRALTGSVLYGLFNFGGTFGFTYYALVRMHGGLGQTLLALGPLATLLLAVAQRQERMRASALAGSALGLAGVAVISRAPLQESVPITSVLAILGAVLCFAEAAVLVRRFPPVHPVAMNAIGMGAGAALLFAITLIARDRIELPERRATWLAIAYLVVLGSGVVFVLGLVVLRYWEASRYSYLFVAIPPIAVAVSAWLDDEPIGPGLLVGGILIVAGVYIGALRRRALS